VLVVEHQNRLVVQCDCNRPTLAAIETEGFAVSRLERTTMPKAPKFVRPLILGRALPAGDGHMPASS